MATYIPREIYENSIQLFETALEELEKFTQNLPTERIFLYEGLLLMRQQLHENKETFQSISSACPGDTFSITDESLYQRFLLKLQGIIGILLILGDRPKMAIQFYNPLRSITAKLIESLTQLNAYKENVDS